MTDRFKTIFKTILAISDALALMLALLVAYIIRVKLTDRPPHVFISMSSFFWSMATLLPLWVIVIYALGLYSETVFQHRLREMTRLALASAIGLNLILTLNYFLDGDIFPAKLVAVYSLFISFAILSINRLILHNVRLFLLQHGFGLKSALIVGNEPVTRHLIKYISDNPNTGYKIVAIVANKRFVPNKLHHLRFSSANSALSKTQPDIIIQTKLDKEHDLYELAVDHHLDYSYIASHRALANAKHTTEIFGTVPLINVTITPLAGYGKFLKRAMDIVGGSSILLLTLPLWLIVAIIMKIAEPQAPIFFKQKRLSRHNTVVSIYKFRSMKQQYNGMTPEEAFIKMGKPELIEKYRKNGDQLDKDPRVTSVGRILRKTSMDELPQLLNVIKGDISLVGPRALIQEELKKYPYKNLILTVKSGLTGLAQVSGRRDISFEERRRLDIYYVHNWSLWLDIQIIFKTIWYVLTRRGAK